MQPLCFRRAHPGGRACVFNGEGWGLLMFGSVVLSLLLQQETGTEIVRSQGTTGFQREEDGGG